MVGDETGWRVDGRGAWWPAFVGLTATYYEIAPTRSVEPANERFAKFLENHVEEIFTFLRHPGTDATNWRGDQAIRPAVVNRKVWGGNRTENGAQAQSLLMSIIRTCYQRLADPFIFLSHQLTSPTPIELSPPILTR